MLSVNLYAKGFGKNFFELTPSATDLATTYAAWWPYHTCLGICALTNIAASTPSHSGKHRADYEGDHAPQSDLSRGQRSLECLFLLLKTLRGVYSERATEYIWSRLWWLWVLVKPPIQGTPIQKGMKLNVLNHKLPIKSPFTRRLLRYTYGS